MSHDQALQKVGEIQALHPDWDPNDIYEALCVTNFNNAQAILKLMIQDKSRKAVIEPTPRNSDSESPFASVGIIQQQYYKEQQLKREGTIVDYFDRNNNRDNYNRHDDDYIAFPSDEENYDDDFQTNEKNNTSTISSPKKNANQSNLQRSRDARQKNHVVQSQYAYTTKEKSGKRSAATQSQISSHFKTNNSEANNKPQASYKSQYSYFGSGFTLRSKSNVHSKVENSSRKRKRSKFLDDFWNSDEEELEDVYVHNSSYNSDSDNSSNNKHRTKSPAEKIQTFKSKYFQQKSHEQVPSDKIDKNNYQSDDQHHEEESIHYEHEEADNYQYEEPTNQRTSFTNRRNEQQQAYAEEYTNEHEVIDDNNEENYHYDDEGQQHYDEEMPREEHQQHVRHDDEQNQEQEAQYDEEYFEDNNNRGYENNENRQDHFRKEIDAKISDIDEEGPSLFIPTILVDSETPDPIVVSDSDSSQLTAPTTNSSINSNNPILIDSSPIRSNESTAETKKNNNNKNSSNNNNVQNISANTTKIQPLDDEMAYFEKIKNATANKRRKIILD